MPIYEYACKACGFEKDVLQKLSDQALTVCLQCGQESFQKRISAAGFRLSGSGWYETDFKTGKKKNLVESAGNASGSAASTTGSSPSTTTTTTSTTTAKAGVDKGAA